MGHPADAARNFHRLTMHDPAWRQPGDPRLVRGFRPMQPQRRPPQFKTYPGIEITPLPRDVTLGESLDVGALGGLLFLSAGVTRVKEVAGRPMYFRAAGSAGNLAPVELYVVTGDLDGLGAGVYHYQPLEHGLVRLRGAPSDVPTALVLTGVPWRTAWKYGERGFRHCYWDAGTMLAHTLAVAGASGRDARLELAFVDAEVTAVIGADGTHEFPLTIVGLDGSPSLPPPVDVPSGHVADDPLEFPLITETQRAGDLRETADVADWRRSAAALAAPPAPPAGDWAPPGPLPELIRRRGSTRRFDPASVAPAGLLTDALAWATRPVPGDFLPAGATLLEHHLAVHAVGDVPAGVYRWGSGGLEQVREGDVRATARHLCLGQDLGGDGCYTAFHCADDRVTEALGSRGYRAAQLQAGIVGGRLHLAAFALGFGASGLTFFDDDVRRAFGTDAWPLLVTAVGAPAYRSKPGGLPGQPARLSPA
ncbi:hypothetical protein BH20ACT9_BH20ACT9_07220 [soil metagenome]